MHAHILTQPHNHIILLALAQLGEGIHSRNITKNQALNSYTNRISFSARIERIRTHDRPIHSLHSLTHTFIPGSTSARGGRSPARRGASDTPRRSRCCPTRRAPTRWRSRPPPAGASPGCRTAWRRPRTAGTGGSSVAKNTANSCQ